MRWAINLAIIIIIVVSPFIAFSAARSGIGQPAASGLGFLVLLIGIALLLARQLILRKIS